jgi:hypothetical protein
MHQQEEEKWKSNNIKFLSYNIIFNRNYRYFIIEIDIKDYFQIIQLPDKTIDTMDEDQCKYPY